VDIVPFGPITGAGNAVKLHPDETHQMNVLGFREACEHADIVKIQANPTINISVASPPGLALLKLIAWTDRLADLRRKDATDLCYLLETYEKIPANVNLMYEQEDVLDSYGWDLTLGGAHFLGADIGAIASPDSLELITEFQIGNIPNRDTDTLTFEMCRNANDETEVARKETLLGAFLTGLASG
jgi:predicted nucleotidyltransferase